VERGEEEEVVMVAEAVDAGWNKVTLVNRCGVVWCVYWGLPWYEGWKGEDRSYIAGACR
jgi:hypothetical protein